jgi:RNA polymerase sigma-70 factor, ECF subfamily
MASPDRRRVDDLQPLAGVWDSRSVAGVSEQDLAALRRPLLAFCYQMLGSPFEAEDAVQDVLERAWRARSSYDASRAALSTWCYRIAHNVCVDRLRGAPRRPLPRDLAEPGIEIGAPLVPALDVPWLMPAPSAWTATSEVGESVERGAEVRLAVTAMLQILPPRQRGAFVLREVLGCSAAETAAALGTTVAAVNSSLQRARAAVEQGAVTKPALGRDVIERYARAIERADAAALAAMVADDVVLEMPPVPAWSRGRETYEQFMANLFRTRGTAWLARPLRDEAQPMLLLYRVTPEGPVPHTVQLVDGAEGGAIEHVLVYQDARLFRLFDRD